MPDDVKLDQIPLLNAPSVPLKGSASALIVQDSSTLRVQVSVLSSYIYNSVVENNPSDIPVGQIAFFARSTAPEGWLVCNGALLTKSEESTLETSVVANYDKTTKYHLDSQFFQQNDYQNVDYVKQEILNAPHVNVLKFQLFSDPVLAL